MRAAIAVLKAGTFSKAAIVRCIGQSGLIKQIVALEDDLGFQMFSRHSRSNSPTPVGEIFLSEAKLSLEHRERAIWLSRAAKQNAEVTFAAGK